jgi:hypothetical protein
MIGVKLCNGARSIWFENVSKMVGYLREVPHGGESQNFNGIRRGISCWVRSGNSSRNRAEVAGTTAVRDDEIIGIGDAFAQTIFVLKMINVFDTFQAQFEWRSNNKKIIFLMSVFLLTNICIILFSQRGFINVRRKIIRFD